MPAIKILVSDLRPGMFIVDTGEPWIRSPYLYQKRGKINSKEEIDSILRQGYAEAYYAPELSNADAGETISFAAAAAPSHDLEPKVALAEELPQAQHAYAACLSQAKTFMDEAHTGKVDVAASEPLVNDIIASLDRNADALTTLVKIRTHDEYTFTHGVNVSIFAMAFGRYLGFDEARLRRLGIAGLFHDVGKMRIPLSILNAPRRLTDEELKIMKTHAMLGFEILDKVQGVDSEILAGVAQHHEKYNGSGYPYGLASLQIGVFGRLISIADCYDALTSTRVYKPPIPMSKALAIMFGMRGEAWEPGLVEHFIKMLGIYPVGTPIILSSGFKGVVSRSNIAAPLCPTALLLQFPNGKALSPPRAIDLASHRDLRIVRPLLPEESTGFDIAQILMKG